MIKTFTREQTYNTVSIVGEISAIEVRELETGNGVPVVAGHIIIKHENSEFKVEYYEMKTWKSGPNPKYPRINQMQEGDKISVSASLKENKYVTGGSLMSNQRLRLSFINELKVTDEPGAKFDIVGVVLSELREIKDSEGTVINHQISIGQGDTYQPDGAPQKGFSIIKLDVDPKNTAVVNAISSSYRVGQTVRVAGHSQATIITKKEVIESVFGDPEERITQTFDTKNYIDKGLIVTPAQTYTEQDIELLKAATTAENELLIAEGGNKAKPKAEASTASAGSSADLLGDLLGV